MKNLDLPPLLSKIWRLPYSPQLLRELDALSVSPGMQELGEGLSQLRRMYEGRDYHSTGLIRRDAEVLSILEKHIGEEVPLLADVSWDTFGFSVDGITVVSLSLPRKNLRELPEEISWLRNLRMLSVYNNHLRSLPVSLGELCSLESFYADNNLLTSLPTTFCELRKLSYLHLSHNELVKLPPCLIQLTGLIELYLSHNQLESLPDDLGCLQSLEMLQVNSNCLSSLPESTADLLELFFLDVRDNRFRGHSEVIESFLERMRRVESLQE